MAILRCCFEQISARHGRRWQCDSQMGTGEHGDRETLGVLATKGPLARSRRACGAGGGDCGDGCRTGSGSPGIAAARRRGQRRGAGSASGVTGGDGLMGAGTGAGLLAGDRATPVRLTPNGMCARRPPPSVISAGCPPKMNSINPSVLRFAPAPPPFLSSTHPRRRPPPRPHPRPSHPRRPVCDDARHAHCIQAAFCAQHQHRGGPLFPAPPPARIRNRTRAHCAPPARGRRQAHQRQHRRGPQS